MAFAFSILGRNNIGWKEVAIDLLLAALTVAADRMIGVLFCISLTAHLVITKHKDVAFVSIFETGLF
jgi:hypothetical protein